MNWLDIVVIAILLINIGLGWFRGLIRSVINIISIVAGFICAKYYYMTAYNLLNEQFDLLNKMKLSIANTFQNVELPSLVDAQNLSTDQLTASLPQSDFVASLLENFIESNQFNDIMQSNIDNFSEGFSTWLSQQLLTIMSMVAVFLLVYLGIRIIGYILNQLFQLPVLNEVNKLTGLVFGCVKGVFFAMLLVLIIALLSPVISGLNLVETLETSTIAIYFYKYNVIMLIFESLI